jgi:hypothetical protein
MVPIVLLALLLVSASMTQTRDTDPILSVTYSLTPRPDCEITYGYGTLSVTNPGSHTISDVNLDSDSATTYRRMDGSPLFPVHFNNILPGKVACVPFQFNLSPSSLLSIDEQVVCLPDNVARDCSTWSSLLPYPQAGQPGSSPGLLINIKNSGSNPATITSFTKPPASSVSYAFVYATSGEAGIVDRSVVVRNMIVPANAAGQILIGLEPGTTGTIHPPDALVRFEGDPSGFLAMIKATAVSDADLSATHARAGDGYQISASFANHGDSVYLLESMVVREGMNFSPSDRTVVRWDPMIDLGPGETWSSPVVYDTPLQDPPVYNAASAFTLHFRRDSGNLTLGLIEPTFVVPSPTPSPTPTPTPSPTPTPTPTPTPLPPIPPGPYFPVIYPIWPVIVTPTPIPLIPVPTETVPPFNVIPTPLPDNGEPCPAPETVEGTTISDYCLWPILALLALALIAYVIRGLIRKG